MRILRMTDLDLRGKRVLIREDLNVPLKDGKVAASQRLEAALPTIKLARDAGARVMLMSHLGRPKEGHFSEADSLAPVAHWLGNALGKPVPLVRNYLDGETIDVGPGEVVLLENCRFNVGEEKDDDALAKHYAMLCDIFVMDAFGTAHRAQASTHGVIRRANVACGGPLLMAELDALAKALDKPARPLLAIVAGSKVSTKLRLLENLIGKVDQLIVGGGIANTFIAAAGFGVGKSLVEIDLLGVARKIIADAKARGGEVPIPADVVVAPEFKADAPATVQGRRRRRRRHDPRHRPGNGPALRGADRQGRHGRLERPGRRVRVRRVRQRHRNARAGDRRFRRILDRRRRRHARGDREIRSGKGYFVYFDRRRRVPRVPRGQRVARCRGTARARIRVVARPAARRRPRTVSPTSDRFFCDLRPVSAVAPLLRCAP